MEIPGSQNLKMELLFAFWDKNIAIYEDLLWLTVSLLRPGQ